MVQEQKITHSHAARPDVVTRDNPLQNRGAESLLSEDSSNEL